MDKPLEKIEEMAEKVANHKDLRLYDLELSGGSQGRVLRIFIDKKAKGDTVSLDDCSEFSKALSLLLDVEDPFDGKYHLEVSSPGVERRLKKSWHYEDSVGEEVELQLNESLSQIVSSVAAKHSNRKKLKGQLRSVTSDVLSVAFEQEELNIPLNRISKAKVVFNFTKGN